LLVIFKIIAHNKARSLSSPLTTTDFLLRPAGEDSELVAIRAVNDDIGFLVLDEPFDLEMGDEGLIFPEFICNISQMLNSHLFACADYNHINFCSQKNVSKNKIVSKSSRLSVRARCSRGALGVIRTVTSPTLPMKVRSRDRLIVPWAEIYTRECLYMFSSDLHGRSGTIV
jgi:hypothetical protein